MKRKRFELTRAEKLIGGITTIYLIAFILFSLLRGDINYAYLSTIVGGIILIYILSRTINFDALTLSLLSLWGAGHLVGGTEFSGLHGYGTVIYEFIRFHEDSVLQFDQVVHLLGFGAATLAAWRVLRSKIHNIADSTLGLFIIFCVGLSIGTFNEIIEFIVRQIDPENIVGGYHNTMLDLIFDSIGSLLAILYIKWREKYS